MKHRNSSSSPQFKPVMTCPVSGTVSFHEYAKDCGSKVVYFSTHEAANNHFYEKVNESLENTQKAPDRLIMLDKDGNRSIFDDVDQ